MDSTGQGLFHHRSERGLSMSDLTASLSLTPLSLESTAPASDDPPRNEMFCWPNPPYAAYPAALPQSHPLACEIVGLNDSKMAGRLIFMVPEEGVAHVQV